MSNDHRGHGRVVVVISALVVAVVLPAAHAQPFGPRFSASAADARAATLESLPTPTEPAQIYDELKLLAEELQALEQANGDDQSSIAAGEEHLKRLSKLNSLATTVDCATDAGRNELLAAMPPNAWDLEAVQANDFATAPKPETCKALLEWLKETGKAAASMTQAGVDYAKKELEAARGARERLKSALGTRREKLIQAHEVARKERNSGQTIADQLLYFLILLVIFCLAMVVGIRIYKTPEQREWIKSGQVIQAMTVIVLLFAVLALGLSKVLSENTLGTLLGGIAGYVLSQGVGKAVASGIQAAHEGDPSARKGDGG